MAEERTIASLPLINRLELQDIVHVNDASQENASNKASEQQRVDLLNSTALLRAGALSNQAVSPAKQTDITQNNIIGRISEGTGSREELEPVDVRSIILDGANLPPVTPPTTSDLVLIQDVSDSKNLKTTDIQGIINLVPPVGGGLLATNNLSDVQSAPNSRINLGLGTAAIENYAIGSWSPILEDSNSNQATMSSPSGTFVRIGDLVHINCLVKTSDVSGLTGAIRVTGLPFETALSSLGVTLPCGTAFGLDITPSESIMGNVLTTSVPYFSLRIWNNAEGNSNMQASEWTDDGDCSFSGIYIAENL